MSLTIIYKKLQELKEKEKKIQDFYDPVKVHKHQHTHIQDLRDDYKEDIQNYGFSRFAFKEEQEGSYEEREKRVQSAAATVGSLRKVTSPSGKLEQLNGTLKSQSAISRPKTAKKQNMFPETQQTENELFNMSKTVNSIVQKTMRPQTAMIQTFQSNNTFATVQSRNVQSALQQTGNRIHWGMDSINDRVSPEGVYQEMEEDGEHYNNDEHLPDEEETGVKIAKHWKFTKKYDTNGKASVRNQSALQKIVVDGQGGEEEVNEERNLEINKKKMEQRFNQLKVFIDKNGEVIDTREIREKNSLKQLPLNERERLDFIYSFNSQREFLNSDEAQNRNIYPPAAPKEEIKQIAAPKLQNLKTIQETDQEMRQLSLQEEFISQEHSNSKHHLKDSTNSGNLVKFNTKNIIKNARPQTASLSSLKTSFKQMAPLSENKKSNRSISGGHEGLKIYFEDDHKLNNMKKIKTAVLNRLGAHKFYSSRDFSPLELTDWYFPNLQKDFSFKVQVIDLKTMNFIKFENVKVINEKLIHTTYKNETQEIEFEKIMNLLGKQHQPTHIQISPLSMFHILIYQKLSSDDETILYEKFIFKGAINRGLDQNVLNLFLCYYVRYLLCFDPSDIAFKSVYNNSLFILERKRTVPQPFFEFFSKLQQKPIYIEDSQLKTTEQFIFSQLQTYLVIEDHNMKINQAILPTHNSSMEFDPNAFKEKFPTESDYSSSVIKRPTTALAYQSAERRFSPLGSAQQQYQNANQQKFQIQNHQRPQSVNQKNLSRQILNQISKQSLGYTSTSEFVQQNKQSAEYVKTSALKNGRPKTAIAKQTSSLQIPNNRHQVSQNLLDTWQPLDGKKYERNIKTFSQPMFIKGQQVKPLPVREDDHLMFSLH